MATDTPNTFETRIAGLTIRGRAHGLSVPVVLGLRLTAGYGFLHAGLSKVLEPGWSARRYLLAAGANGNPLEPAFLWMGRTDPFLAFVDVAVPWGEFLLGVGLLLGAFTRLAALFGAAMMCLFYFGNWRVEYGLVNGDLAYALVFLAVGTFGAGRILGLDALIERHEVGGEPLLDRYPLLRYVLG